MKGLNAQRANTASRIRNSCSAIFGLLDTDLLDPEKRKAKFHGRIGWVPNKSGGGTYSSVDVKIIHKDYSGKYELSKIFLSPVLMAVCHEYDMLYDYKGWFDCSKLIYCRLCYPQKHRKLLTKNVM